MQCRAPAGREIARIRIERRGGEDRNFYDGATSLGRTLLVVSLDQMSHRTLIEGGLRENRLQHLISKSLGNLIPGNIIRLSVRTGSIDTIILPSSRSKDHVGDDARQCQHFEKTASGKKLHSRDTVSYSGRTLSVSILILGCFLPFKLISYKWSFAILKHTWTQFTRELRAQSP